MYGKPINELTSPRITPVTGQGTVISSNDEYYIEEPARWSGQEITYKEITNTVTTGATTEGTATTVVTADAVEYDGKTILIEFFSPFITKGTNNITLVLYDDPGTGTAASIGKLGQATTQNICHVSRYLTPTKGVHIYSIRAYVDAGIGGSITAGAGGSGNFVPAFLRITRAGRQIVGV